MAFEILEILRRGMSTYCESGVGLFDTQLVNTVSNIAIFISAYFSYQLIRAHGIRNLTIRMLPIILAITGIGSMLWHGMPNTITGFADTLPLSVFVLISFFIVLDKLLPNRSMVWVTLFVLTLIEVPFIFGVFPSFNGLIPYLIVLVFSMFLFFGLARKYKKLVPQLTFVVVAFVIALFFRTIDHTVCSAFPLGTHFVWHLLNALAVYLSTRLLVEIEKKG